MVRYVYYLMLSCDSH